jgi:molecular chaperone IbpA
VFKLADQVKVSNAGLEHGLLTIDLAREVPEEMEPRRIAISDTQTPLKIEGSRTNVEKAV